MSSAFLRPRQGFRPAGAPNTPSGRQPAPRKAAFERYLCNAVGARWLVELRYEGEKAHCLFAPHAVFRGSTGIISVSGLRLANAVDAMPDQATCILEVGRITALKVTDVPFEPTGRFDRRDDRHENGVICSV